MWRQREAGFSCNIYYSHGAFFDADWPYDLGDTHVYRQMWQERIGSGSGTLLSQGMIDVALQGSTYKVRMYDTNGGDLVNVPQEANGQPLWDKSYNVFNQDLLTETRWTRPFNVNSSVLVNARRMVPPDAPTFKVETTKEYNFMGNPLEQVTTEYAHHGSGWVQGRQTGVSYAYWGADKYFQQRAVRTKKDASNYRYSFTDYYDTSAATGMKGQTKAVYDAKHATYSLGSSWKYHIVPASGSIPVAEFPLASSGDPAAYDAKGRVIRVGKLSKVVSGTPTYVETRTAYGADTDGSWGQANSVTEAYGTAVARTTYTLAYTADGKACEVQDANGRVFETNYGADGEVNWVKRTDSGLNQTLASYTYGSSGILNGQVTAVSDGLSGVTQSLSYVVAGGGIGQIGQVDQSGGGLPSYSTIYTYNTAGERSEVTYDTPDGDSRWLYTDYVPVGDPSSPARVFQTLRKLNVSTGAGTSEEFHYAYDGAGRLSGAAFGQTPQSGTGAPTSAPYYTSSYPASKRFRAYYEYDAGGRTLAVRHWWDQWGGSSYGYTPVLANECQYDAVKGLKTQSQTLVSNVGGTAWAVEGTEVYGYEAERDFLVSADYDGSGPGAPDTWTYDAAQNRSNSLYTYDALNRMTTSPGYGYAYDAVGNRLSKGGTAWTYTWDALNRMLTHTKSGQPTATYAYRADGMRVGKTYGTATTLYRHDAQMSMQEVESTSGTVTAVTDNALGGRGIEAISRTTSSGTAVRYPLYDAHGSMVGTVANTGPTSLGDRRSYDAWGGVRAGATTGAPNGRYVANLGHVHDDESGLVYMRARYYEPSHGRFINQDPAREGGNWYGYCSNDPINKIDESGKSENDIRAAIGLAVGLLSTSITLGLAMRTHTGLIVGAAGLAFLITWFGINPSGHGGGLDRMVEGAVRHLGVSAFAMILGTVTDTYKAIGCMDFIQHSGREFLGAVAAYTSILVMFVSLEASGLWD
ncbi:MAG: RHS repeat-associated core domain-containing protein [Fimbriimonas sp.]